MVSALRFEGRTVHLLAHPQLLNWALIVLTIGACVRHALAENWLQAAYWFFAAGLNIIVTVGIK